ncbi:hypothetical protein [Mesorhizobium australicum]|uniref:Uncharacterized protein n=1 Tax=Mesorhizobium australicum TaxID=536018 RepID=A0A1X7MQZ7_9HYPH|nr:hypothetical protein [Mesorhizobium australicum]SMH26547.1 hypothetical protein SAMN02982922_0317 [Mesorhizobium australicum]
MSSKETLSLEEFATAPRRQRAATLDAPPKAAAEKPREPAATPDSPSDESLEKGMVPNGASKALRQMKRARMQGASHFVNVNLDRDTKRRLKLASFNLDTSMQAIMEKAIRQYLDANGY